jgi:hypothetical protein
MEAQLVLEYYLEKYQTLGNTLTDIDFENLSFLQEKEAVYNIKGQKLSKSYYDLKGKEVIRITYDRIISDYTYQDIVYSDVFIGVQKTVHYLDWADKIAYSKKKQFYAFDLQPVFIGDGSETVVGFSSRKQRQILKSERSGADDYLQAWDPNIYAKLYNQYQDLYSSYLRTGLKDNFVQALNTETNSAILELLNKKVFGHEPMTIKELIIMNLQ